MKALLLTIFLCAALAAGGCGSDDSSDATGSAGATTESSDSSTTSGETASDDSGEGTDAGAPTKPDVEPPSGPPPKELVIEDVEEGSGPEAKKDDAVTVQFVATDETGKEAFSTWPGDNPGEPLKFKLGNGQYSDAFEEGVEGMKAGGRRELSVPAKQAQYTQSALFYVVDLISIK